MKKADRSVQVCYIYIVELIPHFRILSLSLPASPSLRGAFSAVKPAAVMKTATKQSYWQV
jgi:hypothetical protein